MDNKKEVRVRMITDSRIKRTPGIPDPNSADLRYLAEEISRSNIRLSQVLKDRADKLAQQSANESTDPTKSI